MKVQLSASNLEELKVEVDCIIQDVLADEGEMPEDLREIKQVLDDAVWEAPFYVIEADTDLMEQIDEIRDQLDQ